MTSIVVKSFDLEDIDSVFIWRGNADPILEDLPKPNDVNTFRLNRITLNRYEGSHQVLFNVIILYDSYGNVLSYSYDRIINLRDISLLIVEINLIRDTNTIIVEYLVNYDEHVIKSRTTLFQVHPQLNKLPLGSVVRSKLNEYLNSIKEVRFINKEDTFDLNTMYHEKYSNIFKYDDNRHLDSAVVFNFSWSVIKRLTGINDNFFRTFVDNSKIVYDPLYGICHFAQVTVNGSTYLVLTYSGWKVSGFIYKTNLTLNKYSQIGIYFDRIIISSNGSLTGIRRESDELEITAPYRTFKRNEVLCRYYYVESPIIVDLGAGYIPTFFDLRGLAISFEGYKNMAGVIQEIPKLDDPLETRYSDNSRAIYSNMYSLYKELVTSRLFNPNSILESTGAIISRDNKLFFYTINPFNVLRSDRFVMDEPFSYQVMNEYIITKVENGYNFKNMYNLETTFIELEGDYLFSRGRKFRIYMKDPNRDIYFGFGKPFGLPFKGVKRIVVP